VVAPVGLAAAWRRYWLTVIVHADAFCVDPLGYVQALLWRVRRLRVRSRNKLAALMGQSPRAYALWIARSEPAVRAELLNGPPTSQPILPVIDCGVVGGSIDETVACVSDARGAAKPICIGGEGAVGAAHMLTTSELAQSLDEQGSWLCILNPGDRLAGDAFEIYARAAAQSPERWVIYADDDLIEAGERRSPHFKCSWNPELFEHHDFVTKSAIIRATPEMVRNLPPQDWAESLVRAAIERASPLHIPAVLHHRRTRPEPHVPAGPAPLPSQSSPLVSVIIPTRNNLPLLQTSVDGVRRTAYPNIELIVVDNESDDVATLDYLQALASHGTKLLRLVGPFNFSVLNNAAAAHARGELLCFLNNDIEILDPDWLSFMASQAVRSDLGAVGARLLYPDRSVQHAGVVTGVGGGAAHAHRFQREEEVGYFFRDRLPQRVSAVTAACLVVAKDKFEAVGGFDEQDFPVAFNDVDLCLKLNAKGWHSFYEPRAVLIHHESKSRGSDSAKENRARFAAELAALKRHWGTDRLRDPYHHPHLSPFCEQFRIAV
jgi:GT2 family glycosyltransferase